MRSTVSNADIITINYKEYLLNAVFFKLNCDIVYSLYLCHCSLAVCNLYCTAESVLQNIVLYSRICITL